MTINTEKSKIIYFRRKTSRECILPHELYSIKSCTCLKLLGVTFNENLDFKEHFKIVIKKASQRLYFLRILRGTHTKSELWNVYFTLIRSILEYAAPLFMAITKNVSSSLEKLQRRAHRIICGLHCVDVNCALSSLEDRRVLLSTRLFNNIMRNNVSHPLASLIKPHYSTRGSTNFSVPAFNTNFYKNQFVIQNIFIHNNITNIV